MGTEKNNRKILFFSLDSLANPTPACFALALLAFSFACVNYRQAVNSLVWRKLQRAKLSIYSSSLSKIEDKGKDEPAHPDSQESWSNNCCQQSRATKSCEISFLPVLSRVCDFVASSRLGSSWIVSCENKHCPSRNLSENFLTNLVSRVAEFRSWKWYFPPGATLEPAL